MLERARLVVGGNLTLGTFMERMAAVHGDRVWLTQTAEPGVAPTVLTYRQAAKRVARWAGGISAQTTVGDRVVVAAPNGYELFLLVLAASRAGCVPIPVNSSARKAEIAHITADSGATLVVRSPREVDGAEPIKVAVRARPADVGALMYTSGTTGEPKGARLTHRGLVGPAARAVLYPAPLRHDVAVISLPIAHIMGFTAMVSLAAAGIETHLIPDFDPIEVLDAIEERRASVYVGVPAMYRMLSEAGAAERDLRSVRMWASGADVMPADLAREFQGYGATVTLPIVGTNLGRAMFAEGYGMVELAGGVAAKISPPYMPAIADDALGVPLPGNHLRVVDDEGVDVGIGEVGELWVKGPGVLAGYHGDPVRSAEVLTDDGWLRTGDLARKGPFGIVSFAGRQKDVIINGGYTVYAVEIEATLETHDDVIEAAVVAWPDDRRGEIPIAAVRLDPGSNLTGPDLMAWARSRLSGYKRPRDVIVVDDLPRTATGKVQKVALKEQLAARRLPAS